MLPFVSEPLVIAMVALRDYSPPAIWLAASAGNIAGAVLNWWLARYCLHWQDRSWFPVDRTQLERASRWFQRYGTWTLLFAWAPVGGDALTVAAGLLRVRLDLFILLVGLGKAGRYALLIYLTERVVG